MAWFRYKSISREGRLAGGLVELPYDSRISAINFLEQGGATVVFAEPLHPLMGRIFAFLHWFFLEHRITAEEVAEWLNNIAVMLKAGIPVLGAIQDATLGHKNPSMVKMGENISQRIQSGASFSEAARHYQGSIPATVIYLMRIGEETGSLDLTLKNGASHMLKIARIFKRTKAAMVYPAFAFTAIFGALGFWLYMVVPVMQGLFKSMSRDLPPLTLAVIGASEFVQNYILHVLVGFVLFIVMFRWSLKRYQVFRYRWHWVMLKLPVFKTVLVASNLAFVAEYFALLMHAGVDVLKSIDVLTESLGNEVFKAKLRAVRDSLIQGNTLRTSFGDVKIFPPFVVRMIGVGETTGTLGEQLDFVAQEYDVRLEAVVATIGKMIEPALLVIGGGLFIVVIVAMFLPLYSLVGGG
ncbi:MAG: type II secretion system F family protein [Magnetococcus sp. WYHC-3]